jgi:hypothetical protein
MKARAKVADRSKENDLKVQNRDVLVVYAGSNDTLSVRVL